MTNIRNQMNIGLECRKAYGTFAVLPNIDSAENADRLRCVLSI